MPEQWNDHTTATNQETANEFLEAIEQATETLAADDDTKLKDAAGTIINPATSDLQTTGNGYLSTIATNSGTAATAANQSTSNGYLSTIATNSGTAATAAKQDTGNASLTRIAGILAGVSVAKNTWVALGGSVRMIKLDASSVTASNTATITVYGSPDGGTTYYQTLRGDTGAKARDVALAVGTSRIGTGKYTDALLIMLRSDTTHVYIQQTAQGTDDFTYVVTGV